MLSLDDGVELVVVRGVVSLDGVEFEFRLEPAVRGLGVGGVLGGITPRSSAALESGGIVLHVNGNAEVGVAAFDDDNLEGVTDVEGSF